MSNDVQAVDPNIGDRFVDTSYTKNAPPVPRQRPSRPAPGGYFLQCGSVLVEFVEARTVTSAKDGQQYTFPARIDVQPNFTVVSDADGGDEYQGVPLNKFYRLTSQPVEIKRVVQNYSTLSSCLEAFGLEMPLSGNFDEIKDVCEQLTGMVSIRPIYVSYQGQFNYKPFVKLGNGQYVRLNERTFRDDQGVRAGAAKYKAGGGTWSPVGYVLDPDDDENRNWTLATPSENVAQKKVWANFEPTESGFLAQDN